MAVSYAVWFLTCSRCTAKLHFGRIYSTADEYACRVNFT